MQDHIACHSNYNGTGLKIHYGLFLFKIKNNYVIIDMSRQRGYVITTNELNVTGETVGGIKNNTTFLYTVVIVPLIIFIISGFFRSMDGILAIVSSRLAVYSFVLLVLGIFLQSIASNRANSLTSINMTFQISDRCKAMLHNVINANMNSCPRFMNSFHLPFQRGSIVQHADKIVVREGTTPPDSYMSIHIICNALYQAMEDFLNATGLTFFTTAQLLCWFSSYIYSPIVQKHFEHNKHIYVHWVRVLIQDIIDALDYHKFQTYAELECYMFGYGKSEKFLLIQAYMQTPI
jgi:hypothetical protein